MRKGGVYAFILAVPITKLFVWGEGDSGGHVLRETISRGLCALLCPLHTSERGGEGDCVKEGGGEEGERERERECRGGATTPQPCVALLHPGCVFITAVPITKRFAWWWGLTMEDMCYVCVCVYYCRT